MAKKSGSKKKHLSKHVRDNRANQLNPNNEAYWRARGFSRPEDDSQLTSGNPQDKRKR